MPTQSSHHDFESKAHMKNNGISNEQKKMHHDAVTMRNAHAREDLRPTAPPFTDTNHHRSYPSSASLHLFHPPRRHNTPSPLTLNLTPSITLIRRNQHHLLALLHARLSLASRIVRVQRFDVSECRLLRAAAPRRNSGPLLAAYRCCGGVDATCERGSGD